MVRALLPLALVVVSCFATSAHAQEPGWSLDRIAPPPSPDDGLALQRPETMGPSRFGARMVLDYAHAPLVVDDADADRVGAIVGHRVVGRALFAFGIGERVELAAGIPLTLTQSGDDSVQDAGFETPGGFALGDPSLGGSVLLAGEPAAGGFRLGLAAAVLLPFGDEEQLSGDSGVGARLDLLATYAAGSIAPVFALGFGYRPPAEIAAAEIGPELRYGLGVHIAASDSVRIPIEIHGSTGFDFASSGSAAELDTGVQLRISGLVLDAGLGVGLTRAPGVPDFRVLIALGWATAPADAEAEPDEEVIAETGPVDSIAPPPPPPDADGDGVPDDRDGCPDTAEPSGEDGDGCPARVRFGESAIETATPILFERTSDDLGAEAQAMLREVAQALAAEPAIRFVQVEGYASGEGNRRRSLALSERRAGRVMQFLIENGVDESRLGSVGNGSDQPVDPADTEEAHARNRRVELRIVERAP